VSNWRVNADCRNVDPDLFFSNATGARAAAKRICDGCTVRLECLQLAFAAERRDTETGRPWSSPWVDLNNRHGIYAGLSGYERWLLIYPELEQEAQAKNRRERQPTP
jgi:transcription factor WhiB